MDNHIHFVVEASEKDSLTFIHYYKRNLSRYLASKYGRGSFLSFAKTGMKTINNDYHLKTAIAYCLRNPFVAGMENSPLEYRWSSANCYYETTVAGLSRIDSLSIRRQREFFGTRIKLPRNYMFDNDGMIHPSCYVQTEQVRQLFSNEGNFIHYLFKRIENETSDNPIVRDIVISKGLKKLLSEYEVNFLDELSSADRIRLLKEIKFRYNISERQLARVCPIKV